MMVNSEHCYESHENPAPSSVGLEQQIFAHCQLDVVSSRTQNKTLDTGNNALLAIRTVTGPNNKESEDEARK